MAISFFPAGCFGKLPSFGDFVRHNASNREMLAFDHWLQQGLTHAKVQLRQNWEQVYDNASGQHFVFYSQTDAQFLMGIFISSQDKSVRKYPFWVSLQMEKACLGGQLALLPVIFAPFFEQARQLVHSAAHGLQLRDIVARTESLQVPVPVNAENEIRQHKSYLENTELGAFWQRLFGSFEDARKYLIFKNLAEILLPFRGQDPGRLSLGLRFPLSPENHTVGHDASFWLQVSLRLLGNPALTPVMFWSVPAPEKSAYLFLFFRPPTAKNFVQLVQPDLESDIICELEAEGRDKIAEAQNTMPAQYRALLEARGIALGELLVRL